MRLPRFASLGSAAPCCVGRGPEPRRTPVREGRIARCVLLTCATMLPAVLAGAIACQGIPAGSAAAQPAETGGPSGGPAPSAGSSGVAPGSGASTGGGAGGGAQADFDTLIDLIVSTVESDSWLENGTGEGQIMPFGINGVLIDAGGKLRLQSGTSSKSPAASHHRAATAGTPGEAHPGAARASNANAALPQAGVPSARTEISGVPPREKDPRRSSALRIVSLRRLEAAIAARQRAGERLEESMLTLAGLHHVETVVVDASAGDVLFAGPAGDWTCLPEGAIVSVATGLPLVRLDDLLALWRREERTQGAAFGCSIIPRTAGLARIQELLAVQGGEPLAPSGRRDWLNSLRDALGAQDVQYYGLAPHSRVAGVLLAADYHMKLIGMGLAEGVPGIRSYLAGLQLGGDGTLPAMSVLRWWFSLPSSVVEVDEAHTTYSMPLGCVAVLSENELLAARGERVPTGDADALNRHFAQSFTEHFPELCLKYSIYGELLRLFELATVVSLLENQALAEKAGWQPTLFLDDQQLRLPVAATPTSVDTVINYRVVGRRHIAAGVSGGVWIASQTQLATRAQSSSTAGGHAVLAANEGLRREAGPPSEANAGWWWDAASSTGD